MYHIIVFHYIGVDATLSRWFGEPVPAHLTQVARAVRGLLLSVDPVMTEPDA